MYSVKPYKPEPSMSKEMRLNAQTGAIENGLVYVPTWTEWLDGYLHEMTTFPAGKHDDQVDSTAQALHWIKVGRPAVPGLVLWMEQQLRERGHPVPDVGWW
jgi:phage terminase large subunit-like protein